VGRIARAANRTRKNIFEHVARGVPSAEGVRVRADPDRDRPFLKHAFFSIGLSDHEER
jgi:hypothetical protein